MAGESNGMLVWGETETRKDPITGRMICRDCWNGEHGTRAEPVCKIARCRCYCKDTVYAARAARDRAVARRERLKMQKRELEAEDNPLRAINEEWRQRGNDPG